MAYITFQDNLGREKTVQLIEFIFVIGRSLFEADVIIANTTVSRVHCRIINIEGEHFVEDLESKNGTRVNGALVSIQMLKNGDIIEVGTSRITFYTDGQVLGEESLDSEPIYVYKTFEKGENPSLGIYSDCLQSCSVSVEEDDNLSNTLLGGVEVLEAIFFGFRHIVVVDISNIPLENVEGFILMKQVYSELIASIGVASKCDDFHPEDLFQVLKDESACLFCFIGTNCLPKEAENFLRGLTQTHHRVLRIENYIPKIR